MSYGDRLMVWDLNDYWLSVPEFASAVEYTEGVSDYKPFWPAQEEPESGEPFIVYDNTTHISTNDWWIWHDIVMYQIYSRDLITSSKLTNIMLHLGKSGAESAAYVNQWMRDNGRTDYRLKSIELLDLADVKPTNSEYGNRVRMVTFRVKYTPNLENLP